MKNLIVTLFEKRLGVYIARHPHDKYRNDFIEQVHLELIQQSNGILHIGAHLGSEGEIYDLYRKPTIFIEADPDIYDKLQGNLEGRFEQKAFNFLVGNENKVVQFHRASNNSESSSILTFASDSSFENVHMMNSIELPMTRLDAAFKNKFLDKFDHWVIDVQGAELLVLEGAGTLLDKCKTLFIECSTQEFYKGGVLWPELCRFLNSHGFKNLVSPGNSKHLNILFIRN